MDPVLHFRPEGMIVPGASHQEVNLVLPGAVCDLFVPTNPGVAVGMGKHPVFGEVIWPAAHLNVNQWDVQSRAGQVREAILRGLRLLWFEMVGDDVDTCLFHRQKERGRASPAAEHHANRLSADKWPYRLLQRLPRAADHMLSGKSPR